MMKKTKKYLSLEELDSFLAFCKKHRIRQKDVAEITFEDRATISTALKNKRLKRASARLVLLTKQEELKKDFDFNI